MLVLLVIFMLTTPLIQQGIDVQLPKTQAEGLKQDEEPLVITVKRDGTLYVQRAKVPMKELEEKLKKIFATRGNQEAFLRADAREGIVMVRWVSTLRPPGRPRSHSRLHRNHRPHRWRGASRFPSLVCPEAREAGNGDRANLRAFVSR